MLFTQVFPLGDKFSGPRRGFRTLRRGHPKTARERGGAGIKFKKREQRFHREIVSEAERETELHSIFTARLAKWHAVRRVSSVTRRALPFPAQEFAKMFAGHVNLPAAIRAMLLRDVLAGAQRARNGGKGFTGRWVKFIGFTTQLSIPAGLFRPPAPVLHRLEIGNVHGRKCRIATLESYQNAVSNL